MVGRALTKLLIAKGHQVAILTRNPTSSSNPNISYYQWDIPNGTIDPKAIGQADHIIHLAGAGVADKRWNKARKKEILDDRDLHVYSLCHLSHLRTHNLDDTYF